MSAHIVVLGDFSRPLVRVYLRKDGKVTYSWHQRGRFAQVEAWMAVEKANKGPMDYTLKWVAVPEVEMLSVPKRRKKDRTKP